jgi:hypothetical protein
VYLRRHAWTNYANPYGKDSNTPPAVRNYSFSAPFPPPFSSIFYFSLINLLVDSLRIIFWGEIKEQLNM